MWTRLVRPIALLLILLYAAPSFAYGPLTTRALELARQTAVIEQQQSAPAPRKETWGFKALLVANSTAAGIDTAFTLDGIAHGVVQEANPVMKLPAKHPAAFGGVKAGLNAFQTMNLKDMYQRNPTVAKRAAWVSLVMNAAFATWTGITVTRAKHRANEK